MLTHATKRRVRNKIFRAGMLLDEAISDRKLPPEFAIQLRKPWMKIAFEIKDLFDLVDSWVAVDD